METLKPGSCPFCTLSADAVVRENGHAFALYDRFPVSPGHALIIPKRHIASFFETDEAERNALMELIFRMKEIIAAEWKSGAGYLGPRSQ